MLDPYQSDRTVYTPEICSALDIENDAENEGRLIALVLAWRNRKGEIVSRRFMTWNDLFNYLIKHPTIKAFRRIYAHNGCGFDWLNMLTETDWVNSGNTFDQVKILRDGMKKAVAFVVKLPGKRGSIHLLDSVRLMPGKLENLLVTFGVGVKVKDGVNEKQMGRLYRDNPDLFWKRVESDTIDLLKLIEKFGEYVFNHVFPFDELPMTIGGLSLKYFRSTLKKPLYTTWNKKQVAFFRRSYYGGRVETFFQGVTQAAGLDINSEYPTVMHDHLYPVSYRGAWTRIFKPGGLYEIRFRQTNTSVPAYLRDEKSRKYTYTGQGVFWSWDLENLLQLGGEYEIINGFIFFEWGEIFKEPIEKLYNLRLQFKARKDEAGSTTVKLLMNNMYGKFGQKSESCTTMNLSHNELKKRVKAGEKVVWINGEIYDVYSVARLDHAFVPLASAVTSRGRELIYKYMYIAGNDLLAVDTDSVKIKIEALHHFDDFIHPSKLGYLKEEWQGQAAFIQPKLYAYRTVDGQEHVISKGVKHGLLSVDEIMALALREVDSIEKQWESPTTLSEVLHGLQGGLFTTRKRSVSISKEPSKIGT